MASSIWCMAAVRKSLPPCFRIRVWPALLDEDGEITADDPDDDGADLLVIDIDPREHGAALDDLIRLGRLFVAGPEAGPTPLVLDLDRDLVASVVAAVREDLGPN